MIWVRYILHLMKGRKPVWRQFKTVELIQKEADEYVPTQPLASPALKYI